VDAFSKYAEKYRTDKETGKKNFAIVQAEDELAAIGMVLGASWNGARAFTATSGPGVSLMNEFLGLAYFSEVPTVLIDVQRTGPSTGMPTRTQQSDILEAAYAAHGDTKHVLLFPASPKECFEMTADSFDLAEQLQTPVIVMTDLDLGMNDHISAPLNWDNNRKYNRGKVLNHEQLEQMTDRYGRYLDSDGDGIPFRTIPATHETKGAFVTRGSSRDEYAVYTESSEAYQRNVDRLAKKFETAAKFVHKPQFYQAENNSKNGVIFFGTSTYAAEEAIELLKNEGITLDAMRPKAFPFGKEFVEFVESHEKNFVIEQNRDAQFKSLIMIELGTNSDKLVSVLNYDGMPITADFIYNRIKSEL
jgi:2-oxoglutarate ferredoxin oxidoreductase subunit alpha